MENQLAMFEGQHEVMVLLKSDVEFDFHGDFLVLAKGVATALEYSRTEEVTKFCKEGQVFIVKNSDISSSAISRNRKLNNTGEAFITNLALNRVFGKSEKPKAEPFQDWLYEDIIPSVQKTGSYSSNNQQLDTSLLSPEMQMFKQLWDGLAYKEIEDKRRDNEIKTLKDGFSTMQETFLQHDEDWRNSINKMLKGSAFRTGGNYGEMRSESYKLLEERGHCDLNKRLRNLKDRLADSGATKTKIENMTRMDVIEADPRLKEIYTTIVKEFAIGTLKIAR